MKDNRFSFSEQYSSDTARIITDTRTGVQYLLVQSGTGRGGLTVLLDKDGKPLIDDRYLDV